MSVGSVSHPTAVFALGLGRKVFIAIRGIDEIPEVAVCWATAFLKTWSKTQENMCKKACVKYISSSFASKSLMSKGFNLYINSI